MTGTVKKTISLPPDLARSAEQIAPAEGKTLSAVVQDALRDARVVRLRSELDALQSYWSRRAKEQGTWPNRICGGTCERESGIRSERAGTDS